MAIVKNAFAFMMPLFLIISCGKKDNSSSGEEEENPNVKADSIDDFNLTNALSISVSDAVAGKGSYSLSQLTRGKSAEACRIRQTMKQSIMMLEGIKSSLCHIEVEAKKIGFNKPVLLAIEGMGGGGEGEEEMPEGPGEEAPALARQSSTTYLGIYVDTKKKNGVKVYMCSGDRKTDLDLTQTFKIVGSHKKKSKGQMLLSFDMGGMTFAAAVGFDTGYTKKNREDVELKIKFGGSIEGFGDIGFANYLKMSAENDLISIVTSESGEFGDPMKNAAAAIFDNDHGHVFYSLNTTHEETEFTSETEACVEADGTFVDCDGKKFAKGGDLYLTVKDVPGFLSKSFTPDKPAGFKCNDQEWKVVKLDLSDPASEKKHAKCSESNTPFEEEDCWDETYVESSESANIPDPGSISGETPGEVEAP